MVGKLLSSVRAAAGIADIADMGVVFNGTYGYNDCSLRLRIESLNGLFFLCIEDRLSRGAAFVNTKVVKWPYSQTGAGELDAVLQDLRCVAGAPGNACLTDRRGAVGRLFDKMTGRKYLGEYTFASPLNEDRPRTVDATVTASKAGLMVTLAECRKSSTSIQASMPLDAIPTIINALQAWRQ
jgi:hypothetical protein